MKQAAIQVNKITTNLDIRQTKTETRCPWNKDNEVLSTHDAFRCVVSLYRLPKEGRGQ